MKNFEPKLYFGAGSAGKSNFSSQSQSLPRKGVVIGEGKLRHAKRAVFPFLKLPNFEAKLYLCAGLHGELVFDPKESFPNFNLKLPSVPAVGRRIFLTLVQIVLLTLVQIVLLTLVQIVLLTLGKIVLLTLGKIVLLTHGKIGF